jgi:predicted ATPase
MLTSVHIKDYRLCEDVRLHGLGMIAALIGRNGVGKTNVLQGISRTAKWAVAANGPAAEPSDVPGSATLEFEAEGANYRYTLTLIRSQPRPLVAGIRERLERRLDGGFAAVFERDQGVIRMDGRPEPLSIGERSPAIAALTALLPADDSVAKLVQPAMRFLSGISYYSLEETDAPGEQMGWVDHSEYQKWAAGFEATGVPGDSTIRRLTYLSLRRTADFDVLKDLLGPNGLGLVDAVTVHGIQSGEKRAKPESGPDFYFIWFQPSRGSGVKPVMVAWGQLSVGTRRVIRLLTSMLFDKSSVMLVEQPEDGLHPGMTKKLFGLLRDNAAPAQVVLSSHSSALLNRLRPEEVRLVYLEDGFTRTRQLDAAELAAAAKFMNEEGPLSEFLEPIVAGG